MSKIHETDVVIIGAGPVGLFAVFELGMLKIRCHVVDTLEFTGGQCRALYPEKPIYDIPGYPEIMAEELVTKLEEQAAPFAPVYHLGQQVIKVKESGDEEARLVNRASPEPDPAFVAGEESIAKDSSPKQGQSNNVWEVETSNGIVIRCKAIMIAAGCGAFGPNRPPLEGLEAYEGTSVFYMVGKREDFRGKKIVIGGGGDSAADWAISLSELAEKLYLVHRRPKFRCAPESAARMQALADEGKIEMVIPYQLSGLKGRNGKLEAVLVADLDGNTRELEADMLLPFYGLSMELGPIAGWGLSLHKSCIAVEPSTCETSAKGIFAVGDIATYKNKLKLIACGFSEAAMAAHAIYPLVHPDEALHFEYSTTKGAPGK